MTTDWKAAQAQAAQQKVLDQNRVLRLDGEALAIQQKVDTAFKLSGQGPAPEPQTGQTASEYRRMCVSRLKGCAGWPALDTTPLSDGVVGRLLNDCVEGVAANWQRPPDVPAGQTREVSVTDRAGRAMSTLVVGHGTESAFKTLYGQFMTPPQRAVSFGGVEV